MKNSAHTLTQVRRPVKRKDACRPLRKDPSKYVALKLTKVGRSAIDAEYFLRRHPNKSSVCWVGSGRLVGSVNRSYHASCLDRGSGF